MRKLKGKVTMVALSFAATMLAACSDNKPGAMEDQPASVVVKSVDISGFSEGQQTVGGLEDGIYSLQFFAKGEGRGYVEAGGKRTALVNSPQVVAEGFVRGIEVSGGSCTISLNGADASQFSTMRLVKGGKPYTLLKGGDISQLTNVERHGGKYYDNGQQGDCIDILKANGVNLVRLRLFNEPGKYAYQEQVYSYDDAGNEKVEPKAGAKFYRLPEGVQTEEAILALAKRAKAAGMQLLLTFHYSDFWSDGNQQHIPHAWLEMDAEQTRQALYDFTYGFMEKMKAQGTTPELVSIGNETQAGMLYPLAGPLNSKAKDYYQKTKNLAAFYNAGYDAVKASAPGAKVIVHLNGGGDKGLYNWYFGLLKDMGAKYDVIGASYYPYWTERDAKTVCEWSEYVTDRFDKDLMFMEVGYAWQQKLADGIHDGQLSTNWPYTDMSQAGQKNFMLELVNEIKKVKNQRVLGFAYWDPIFIPAPSKEDCQVGWALDMDGNPELNVVTNSTLFDFDGNTLEVFDAFRNNN